MGTRSRGEELNAGQAVNARNSAKARCSERASVSFRIPTPNVNGSGDAYQNWNSAQASATLKMTLAGMPTGFRAPVSTLATSSCSASGAFSISVAILVPPRLPSKQTGAKSPPPPVCLPSVGLSAGPYDVT